MNSDGGTVHGEVTDAAISAAYQAAADEISPADLDDKILREARQEVRNNEKPAWNIGWLRPVTFLATAGLSIALLLQLSELRDFGPPSGIDFNMRPSAPEIAADGELPAQPETAKADAERSRNRTYDNTARVAPPTSQIDNDGADEFRRAANDAAKQVQAVDTAANATLSEMPEADPPAEYAREVSGATSLDSANAPRQCTAEQRANAADWWLCVTELQKTGLATQAQVELQNLQRLHPSFSPQ